MPFLKLLVSRRLPLLSNQLVLKTLVGVCKDASTKLWRMASKRSCAVRGALACDSSFCEGAGKFCAQLLTAVSDKTPKYQLALRIFNMINDL
jgi:hypothetical protein